MYFAGYNDYELIYLVNEGSERALNVLYQKYYIYIYKVAAKYIPRGDKKNDLIQEGLMLLNQSIKRFNPRFDKYLLSILTSRLLVKQSGSCRT